MEVKWATATEFDNAGFNIHRSVSKEGERLMLNSELIAAQAEELDRRLDAYRQEGDPGRPWREVLDELESLRG